jgi:hypothetical protein
MGPNLVKAALVLFIIGAGFSVYILWRNASAPDALKNAGIVVASILPVALSIFPYLTLETVQKRLNYMLLFDSEAKKISYGQIPNHYFVAYIPMFANLPDNDDAFSANSFTELMGKQGLDFVERGVLEGLLSQFSSGWDIVKQSKFKGPGFTSGDYTLGSSKEKTEVSLAQLRKVFDHNPLISRPGVVVSSKLVLPPKTDLRVEPNEQGRTLNISNSMLGVKIAISPGAGWVQQHGIPGVLYPDPENMNRYSTVFFRVTISGELNRTRVHSPEMGVYRRWFDNLTDTLSRFDWETIDNDIQQTSLRKAVSKILGQ